MPLAHGLSMNLRTLTVAALLAALLPALRSSAPPARTPSNPWTLRYVTLRGAAVDFLVRDPNALTKGFHGRPVVLKNETYRTVANLAERFSAPYSLGSFSRADLLIDAKTGSKVVAKDLIGKPFFVGDTNARAGMAPSSKSDVAYLKQILKGDPQWRVAVTHAPGDKSAAISRVMFWRSADAASLSDLARPERRRGPPNREVDELRSRR